ncbi:uncharacterized protein KY384_005280 [Bacidia gigantensis]|uniref:uncharacterized protein n=1 Tax=Bacidia gigantensis TaxID=2732470 RepID=UPI001D047CDF|nr:uncharacterized protein KY384_005280 [Bacidia gigantensis]KAG8529799.1 hypothetical protein KY384_005280 [Bacidia gigantensis]
MDLQRQSIRDLSNNSTEAESLNNFPAGTGNGWLGDPSIEGQEEPQAPPTYVEALDQQTHLPQLRRAVPQHDLASLTLNQQPSWWRAEAKKILCSGDLQLIQLLLRFGLYGDESSLHHNLQHVWTFRLDDILTVFMDRPQVNTEREHKVNKIVELAESDRTFLDVSSNWEPRDTVAMDAEQIAIGIEQESHWLFRNIRIENCLKYAIGWMEKSIEHLFVQHRCFSLKIRCYLREFPTQRKKFIHVEEKLRNRSALAHQAVLNGLLPPEYPAYFNLEPICEPLRTFAEDETISLGAILTRLQILTERFDYTYKQALPTTWPRFRIEVDTFNALISTPAIDYAREMTISDMQDFDLVCPKALKNSGSQSIHLLNNWCSFRDAIAECCKAYPRLNYRVNEIAHVRGLRCYRNWHRLAAIVHGQKQAGADSPHYSLINPNGNYMVFRAEMRRRPGLPFLTPYLTQYTNAERLDPIEAFSFVSYNMEAAFAQSVHRPGALRNFVAYTRRAL